MTAPHLRAYTPAVREEAYLLCAKRDGHKCNRCKKVPAKPITDPKTQVQALTVDHIDGNTENNPEDGSNWQLLCQSCNNKKRVMPIKRHTKPDKYQRYKVFRTRHERERGREKKRELENGYEQSREMDKNDEAEPEFERFVREAVTALKEVRKSHLLDAGAMNNLRVLGFNISQQALSRYLSKWTNPINGDFEEYSIDDRIHIRLVKR